MGGTAPRREHAALRGVEVLRRKGANCRDLYDRLVEYIYPATIDGVDVARVVDVVDRPAEEEEREHLEGLEEDLDNTNRLI